MKIIPGSVRSLVLRGSAVGLNLAYNVASAVGSGSLRAMAKRYPSSFIMPPEKIEVQTAHRLAPTLQHVVKEMTGTELPKEAIIRVISDGLATGLFKNYGERILINPLRADELLPQLGMSPGMKDLFLEMAKRHYISREYVYADQANGYHGSSIRTLERGTYYEREYSVLTRDGRLLKLKRIINQDKVKTNDDRPSVLLIPGTACNHKVFDLDDDTSLALELADQGNWVYLFDSRGMGVNKGDFDPVCFFDTLIMNDLPAALDFIYNRPKKKKPAVVIGHSLGGLIAEFVLMRQAFRLNGYVNQIAKMMGDVGFQSKGRTRDELREYLKLTEKKIGGRAADREIGILIAEAKFHLGMLDTVKGLVTMGSPKIFDKNHHPIFPVLLMLNILLPLLREKAVPVDKLKMLAGYFPFLFSVGRALINSKNFEDPGGFLRSFISEGTDTFPLGVGFQMLKAIYSGKGLRRMDKEKYNYSAHVDEIPPDIPIFNLLGTEDPLCQPFNLAFIDHDYYKGDTFDFSAFADYQHEHRSIFNITRGIRPEDVPIRAEKSQVQGYLIEGVSHLDFYYGKTAQRMVRPLLRGLIEAAWQA